MVRSKATLLALLPAATAFLRVRTQGDLSATGGAATACDPNDSVCGSCRDLCVVQVGDSVEGRDSECLAACRVAVYSCHEPDSDNVRYRAEVGRASCIQAKLTDVVREHASLVTKVWYDVPLRFGEVAKLATPFDFFDEKDVEVLLDTFDGGDMPMIPAMPLRALLAEADSNADGRVSDSEWSEFGDLGRRIEQLAPTPARSHNMGNIAADMVGAVETAGESLKKKAANSIRDAAKGVAEEE